MRPTLALASIASLLTLSPGASSFYAPRVPATAAQVAGATSPVAVAATDAPAALGTTHHATARASHLGPSALRFGRSIGSPTEGRLLGGAHLDETTYLRIVQAYVPGDVRWGLEPLVAMLDRAARSVRRQFPDAVLSVGHLSRAGGGDIDRHRSHESGRDADVSFYVRSSSGRPLTPTRFVAFRGDGSAALWPGAYFDDARNWALVAALVSDPEAHVTHLFVAAPLRARLLEYAEHMGVAGPLRVRAAEAMQQPHGALPHDDHFHVRIGCPAHMTGCLENPAAPAARGPTWMAHGPRGAPSARPVNGNAAATHTLAPPTRRAPTRNAEPAGSDEPPQGEAPAPPAVLGSPVDDVDG